MQQPPQTLHNTDKYNTTLKKAPWAGWIMCHDTAWWPWFRSWKACHWKTHGCVGVCCVRCVV